MGYPTSLLGSRWDIPEIAVGSRWDIPSPGDGIEVGFPTYSRLCRSFQNRTRGRTGSRTLCFTGTHTHRSRIGKFRAHRSAHDGVNPIQKARLIRCSPNFLELDASTTYGAKKEIFSHSVALRVSGADSSINSRCPAPRMAL